MKKPNRIKMIQVINQKLGYTEEELQLLSDQDLQDILNEHGIVMKGNE